MVRKFVLIPLCAALSVPLAHANPGDEQGQVRKELRAGNVIQLRDIETRVIQSNRGMEYVGSSYDSAARVYQLRFMREGRVVDVYVDARTGEVLRQSR